MRKITKIDGRGMQPVRRKRVAAYARVSSGKDAQLHSLSAQISYYNNYIGSRGDWELVGIYADEAMTGTKDDRPQFQKMLADCRAGKIDMVIVKSLTRLARNTVTLLETARELKLLGIDVFFEKENIHTMSGDGELMLTLLASFAQEESRSVSENIKWRIRKNFELGIPNAGNTLGYRLKNGTFEIVPEEAEVVRQIFTDYLSGMGRIAIARKLTRMGIPTKHGEQWNSNTLYRILRNEKYVGDLILQKTYRPDHISKKSIDNHGELPKFFVENAHEPIIDRDMFNQVQQEIARRKEKHGKSDYKVTRYPFTGVVRCGLCGKHFLRKSVASGNRYAPRPVWICYTFNTHGRSACAAQQIPEKILTAKTLEVLNLETLDRETLLRYIAEIQVPAHNHLRYVFLDGHTQDVTWQNPSRRESWTEEMRQKAREQQQEIIERRRKDANR